MLEKKTVLDQIEVKSDGLIFVKELIQITENGNLLTQTVHRFPLEPGADVSEVPYPMVQNAVAVHWTSEVIETYKIEKAKRLNNLITEE